LNSGHKPKPAQTARLPDLPHEVEVQHQVGLLARSEIIEKFVHDKEQPLTRVLLPERQHHRDERILMVDDLAVRGEGIRDAQLCKIPLEFTADDIPKRLPDRTDLRPDNDELAGDAL